MITNGHAARMRFSRFKSAQEGTQSKPRKPRAQRDSSTARGARGRAVVKKSKTERGKPKEKNNFTTPPAMPVGSNHDDEMAIDSAPLLGMNRQLRLPTEPASFTIKPDPDTVKNVERNNGYIKTEPDLASETSLESADFGQTVDMLGQVNIDNLSRHHFYPVPSTPLEVMTPLQVMPPRDLATPEMSLSPSTPPSSMQRARLTPEILAPRPLMGVTHPERALFHRHYNNGMPVLASALVPGVEVGKDFVGFEEYMRGSKSEGDISMEDDEPVVKKEHIWDESY